ncbi:CaiB/BaiF CoA-transferase family protein [Phytohabitans sp. ZYX-F-186]|uniref:CaiB/BaiF CoA-transferase family protein n=1 Tax=Phytohabitans maris TaxID=3071409 RepID=A0ABU0ZPV5_9ACTN|nr:CaiB/BaiF CoA-transferase family protein [Phytohabitans sp. ZYX-F-186]MDQ7909075.1 CaiB/BaiF CoA-transferase family protein [Phytohabitans sp. ZYX-F-186]
MTTGALNRLRVLELAGIGPTPHAAMLLGDMGASVLRVERPGAPAEQLPSHVLRNRTIVEADLKRDLDRVLDLVECADVLIEGFRPGVAERLGIGPEECLRRNARLVYGRMTGWGQQGQRATTAGHDLNYISVTGALDAIGPPDTPVPPLNLVGDFGGGSLFLVVGVLAALVEREHSGLGQVVDAAMVDGVSVLAQHILEMRAQGRWSPERAANLLDGGAPFYRTYECADGRFVAVAALEPKFYTLLLHRLGLARSALQEQYDRAGWPVLAERFASVFRTRTRDEWAGIFAGTDACVTPVLTFDEAVHEPHLAARGALRLVDGHVVAGHAPRFGRSVAGVPSTGAVHTDLATALVDWRSSP